MSTSKSDDGRDVAASLASTLDINREILKEVYKLYKSPPSQLKAAAKTAPSATKRLLGRRNSDARDSDAEPTCLVSIGQSVHHPVTLGHQKATVMVIGNISAGKSTFINWLVQEAVQKTGMAIETSGFTFITSGRCVTEIGGESTLPLRPHLQHIAAKYPGFLQNLSLKTCPSRNGRLQLIDLVDTPGLADGELQYPFNVEKIIVEMTSCVDLFLVFFDPIGQALGRRVLSVVEQLTETCPDKVRFCLTKVDQIRTEEERIKVMCQTTQSLTAKIKSRHGFDLIPLYIPGATDGTYLLEDLQRQDTKIVNRLQDLVDDIERSTERRVQDALNGLHHDVTALNSKVDRLLERQRETQRDVERYASRSRRKAVFRFFVLLAMAFLALLHGRSAVHPFLSATLPVWAETIDRLDPRVVTYLDASGLFVQNLGPWAFPTLWTILCFCLILSVPFGKRPRVPSTAKDDFSKLLEFKEFLKTAKLRWKSLNRIYLNHTMADPSSSSQTSQELM